MNPPTRGELIEALTAATLVLRNCHDSDEDGHAALELCERVMARAEATLCTHGHVLTNCLHRRCIEKNGLKDSA